MTKESLASNGLTEVEVPATALASLTKSLKFSIWFKLWTMVAMFVCAVPAVCVTFWYGVLIPKVTVSVVTPTTAPLPCEISGNNILKSLNFCAMYWPLIVFSLTLSDVCITASEALVTYSSGISWLTSASFVTNSKGVAKPVNGAICLV